MSELNNYRLILEELDSTLSQVDNTEYERFANDVIGADRIFTAGKGRSLSLIHISEPTRPY